MTLVYRLWVGQLDSSVVVAMVFSFLVPWFKTPLGSLEQHCYHIFELSVSCQMIIISILANFNSERYFLPVGYGGSQKVFQKTGYSRCKSFLYFLTFFLLLYTLEEEIWREIIMRWKGVNADWHINTCTLVVAACGLTGGWSWLIKSSINRGN